MTSGWAPLTELTVDQVRRLQSEIRKRGGQSPVGKYQFMPSTLDQFGKALKLTGQEKFTPELQDRLMREMLRSQGYDDYLAGRKSEDQLMDGLAKRWRSVEYRRGRTRDGQHLGTSRDVLRESLRSAKAEAEHLSDLGLDPYGLAWR